METSEEIKESEEGKILCNTKMATKIHSVILENVIAHLHKILVEKVTYILKTFIGVSLPSQHST